MRIYRGYQPCQHSKLGSGDHRTGNLQRIEKKDKKNLLQTADNPYVAKFAVKDTLRSAPIASPLNTNCSVPTRALCKNRVRAGTFFSFSGNTGQHLQQAGSLDSPNLKPTNTYYV
jgi:hypothetical protein